MNDHILAPTNPGKSNYQGTYKRYSPTPRPLSHITKLHLSFKTNFNPKCPPFTTILHLATNGCKVRHRKSNQHPNRKTSPRNLRLEKSKTTFQGPSNRRLTPTHPENRFQAEKPTTPYAPPSVLSAALSRLSRLLLPLFMEFYNTHQIQQLAPLVTLSLHNTDAATHLKSHLQKSDIANCIWDNSILKNRLLSAKYVLQFCDEAAARANIERKPKEEGTHSATSPFNAESDLFPNGILSEKWFAKYTQNLPFALVQTHILGDPADDEALGEELAAQRQRYADWRVKYVAVLLSDGDPIVDQDRIDKLRLLSGLPRLTGIFYLNSDKDTLDRDCGILASSLFNNLKAPAADFYSGVEARLKQRYKKYYTMPSYDAVDTKVDLTPKVLEVRNMIKQAIILQLIHPHNVESSFAMLELSYERLIDLTADHADVFFSESVSDHDTRLYAQFRQLLDVIAIHLIRGYLSTEEPTAALRKHEAHIANVLSLCKDQPKSDNAAWVSVQYQWLAELMQMVPPSVLSDLELSHQVKQKSYQNCVAYFGGSTFHDTFNSTITTQAFLIFLKAFTKLKETEVGYIQLPYLKKLDSVKELQNRRIELLDKAKDALQAKAQDHQLDGVLSYLDWLLAEEQYHNEQYEDAEQTYRAILDRKLPHGWRSIRQLLTQRLVDIYRKLNSSDKLIEAVAVLASQNGDTHGPAIEKLTLDRSAEINFDASESFFNVEVNLFNSNLKKEFFAFDTIVTQLAFSQSFSTDHLREFITDGTVQLSIEKVVVNYDGRPILIKNQEAGRNFSQVQLGNVSEYNADLSVADSTHTLQILDEVMKPCKYKIESVEIMSVLTIKASGHTVTLRKSEIHSLLTRKNQAQSFTALIKEGNCLKRNVIRAQGQDAFECTVQPYKPDVSVALSQPLASIIMGEKIEVPLRISCNKAPNHKANFSSLNIQLKSRLLEGEQEQEYLVPQTNWKDLKDDEDLSILNLFDSDGTVESSIQVSIRKPPSMLPKLDIKLVLEMQLLVGESDKSLSVYDLKVIDVPVLWRPFLTKLGVTPRYREDSSLDMKNPFILSDKEGDVDKNLSMPSPSRVWAAEATIKDTHQLIGKNSITIKRCLFTLRSKNPEVEVQIIEDARQSALYASQVFVSNSRHRYSHRLIGVAVSALYIWTRGENGPENEFETDEWEVSLPLQDPRVLLHSAVTKDGKTVLKYVIENPTSRIFTFTTSLTTEESALRGVNWKFEDDSNIVPLKQGAFPVLPFSRHEMVFTGTYEVDEDEAIEQVELPQMHVYDLNYKVSLPTLPVSESVVARAERLYMKT